jgi:2-polyprenyl-6-methoxyphenol hydroxylase-like FAD-dependent oxidoreductase
MRLSSTRHVYPLVATFARRFVGPRFALVGDAAVGMHPVTAHGFNLGLRSQDTLAESLRRAAARGGDIGAADGLLRYESRHRRHARPLYLATNAIVRLYTDPRPLAALVRRAALEVADRFAPFKHVALAALTEANRLGN